MKLMSTVSLRGASEASDEAIFLKRLLRSRWSLAMTLIVCLSSCQAAAPKSPKSEAISAVTTVTQGLTGLSAWHTVKYCPENGERFSADMIWCPDHKVRLEWVE